MQDQRHAEKATKDRARGKIRGARIGNTSIIRGSRWINRAADATFRQRWARLRRRLAHACHARREASLLRTGESPAVEIVPLAWRRPRETAATTGPALFQ